MARYYRRRYSYRFRSYRRSNRKWKAFSKYNYANVKLDINFHIQYPENSGPVTIYFGQNVAARYYGIGSLMNDHCSDWLTYKTLYQFYKLRGIKFECTPMCSNAGNENVTQSAGVYLGYCLVTPSDQTNTSWLENTDKAFVVNPLQKSVKYFNNYGSSDDWKSVNTALGGNFSVYSSESSTLTAGPIWHVRAILYVTMKMANK